MPGHLGELLDWWNRVCRQGGSRGAEVTSKILEPGDVVI